MMSMSTTSTSCICTASTASSPLVAWIVVLPRVSSTLVSSFRFISVSSTTSTRYVPNDDPDPCDKETLLAAGPTPIALGIVTDELDELSPTAADGTGASNERCGAAAAGVPAAAASDGTARAISAEAGAAAGVARAVAGLCGPAVP